MNKLFAAAMLAALASSPALAKTTHAQRHVTSAESNAMAMSPEVPKELADPNAVWAEGTYVGSDPDPQIRLNMETQRVDTQ